MFPSLLEVDRYLYIDDVTDVVAMDKMGFRPLSR